VGGWAVGLPGGAQGRAEGKGGWMIDTVGHLLACFDRHGLHSFSLDSGMRINSVQIYPNLLAHARTLNIVTIRNRLT